ncbi:MAG: OmpA family protein [Flavipsychrobacter sp.]|nr:OmpA family protein [Flavipsychrobacter sp.]
MSDREGGYGGKDIWVSRFEEGYWQAPKNLGPHINTRGDELTPYLHMDNRTLYFSSNGLPGMGGADLYYSRRVNDSTWGKPANMGYPINTTAEEVSICLTEDGKRAYFASDRNKVLGDFDLYEVRTPKESLPVPVSKMTGYVYDSFSKQRLIYTAIFIYDAATNEELYHFNSNRGNASYMITLPSGKDFICKADGIGHMERVEYIHLNAGEAKVLNIAMLPDDYVAPIEDSLLCTIYFPLNSSALTDADKSAIYTAVEPWLNDGGANYYINGYTDTRGNPLVNEQLSFERARLVSDQLSSFGIDPDMMNVKGWGEANPVADNETEEGQSRNRRVELILRR